MLNLFEAKKKNTDHARQTIQNNKYDKEIKIYRKGVAAMRKVKLFDKLNEALNKIGSSSTRAKMLNDAKKEGKLMLTRDYLSLLKFKQLCVSEQENVLPPNKVADRRLAWEGKYKHMANPLTPPKPN